MVLYKDIITILLTTVYNIDGGCHVNKWPSSCEANFRIGPEKCEPCEPGRYGCNCSQTCTPGTFGLNCYFSCNCSDDEVCDPKVGCTSNETSVFTTDRIYNTGNLSVHSTFHSETYSTNLPFVSSGKKSNILNEVTISLLVSSAAVVFFSILCAFILIRLSKRIYKREYRKLLNNLQMTGMRSEDENIYSEYNYTDSSLLNTRICPSTDGDDSYDHSIRENYNILSLRSRTSRVNQYDVESNSTSTSLHSIKFQQFLEESEADFVLEPECLINLFQENQIQQPDTSREEDKNDALILDLNGTNSRQTAGDLKSEMHAAKHQLVMEQHVNKQEVIYEAQS